MDILSILKPCATDANKKYIEDIITKILKANIFDIVLHILTNSPSILKDIADALKSYKQGNYTGFGFDFGDIIYRILLK